MFYNYDFDFTFDKVPVIPVNVTNGRIIQDVCSSHIVFYDMALPSCGKNLQSHFDAIIWNQTKNYGVLHCFFLNLNSSSLFFLSHFIWFLAFFLSSDCESLSSGWWGPFLVTCPPTSCFYCGIESWDTTRWRSSRVKATTALTYCMTVLDTWFALVLQPSAITLPLLTHHPPLSPSSCCVCIPCWEPNGGDISGLRRGTSLSLCVRVCVRACAWQSDTPFPDVFLSAHAPLSL